MTDLNQSQQQQQEIHPATQQQQLLKGTPALTDSSIRSNPRAFQIQEALTRNLRAEGYTVIEESLGARAGEDLPLKNRVVSVRVAGRSVIVTPQVQNVPGSLGVSFMLQPLSPGPEGQCLLGRYELSGSGALEFEPCYVAVDHRPREAITTVPREILEGLNAAFSRRMDPLDNS